MKPKTSSKQPAAADTTRLDYYRDRNARLISFVVEDPELKQRIIDAAKRDGRAVNSWIVQYILPGIEAEVARQEAKGPSRPRG